MPATFLQASAATTLQAAANRRADQAPQATVSPTVFPTVSSMAAPTAAPMAAPEATIWRVTKGHRRAACGMAVVLVAVGVLAIPFGRIMLPASASFMPAFGTLTGFADLLTAVLLFAQAKASGHRPTTYLATAYLVSALAIIPHLLAFPGAVTQAGVIGSSVTAVWLWCVWHTGFALCVCRSALAARDGPRPGIARLVAGSVAAVLAFTLLATWGLPLLPAILVDGSFARLNSLGIGPVVVTCNVLGLGLVLWRLRRGTVIGLWLSVAMLAASIDVMLTLFGGSRFTLGWYVARGLSLATGISVLVAMLSELMNLFHRSEATNRHLQVLSLTDGLTGIPNRRWFDGTLDLEWRRATREQTALSLLMIDIDVFKAFNDRYGHPAGDECLRQVSQAIWAVTRRAGDAVARIGGEEFAVLLPVVGQAGAAEVALRIHAEVAALAMRHEGSPFGKVSISIGLFTSHPARPQTSEILIAAADSVLYRAKALGRNRTECGEAPPSAAQPPTACLSR